jgi:hypothetical protein
MTKQPIGASVTYQWLDDKTITDGYVSFGDYLPDENKDSYDIDDDAIFYYAEGEQELKDLTSPGPANDFIILNYELEYAP